MEGLSLRFSLDKHGNYDRIKPLKAMTEQNLVRSHEREGTVRALGKADRRATPEQPAMSGTAHPRYRMN